MMSKMKCFGVLAGCVLATGALYADPISHDFESTNPWSGGSLFSTNYALTAAGTVAGYPIPSAGHTKVLSIEGNASYTPGSAVGESGTPLVDMMVQTARPDDELGFPSNEETSDIQIAVAVDSNGCFNVWCKNKAGSVNWYKLSNKSYGAAEWARVSFLFDYTNQRCQIRIDGEPVMSENGYLAADASDNDNAAGSWYRLAKNNSSGVASMTVIGCTAIDDVVMNETSASYPIAASEDAAGVPYSWYDSYGISWAPETLAPDGSGMTNAEKYERCLSPLGGEVFAVKSMTVTENAGTTTMSVGIPEFVVTEGRKVVIDYGTDSTFTTASHADVPTGQSAVNIDVPSGAVIYYRLRATTTQTTAQ